MIVTTHMQTLDDTITEALVRHWLFVLRSQTWRDFHPIN